MKQRPCGGPRRAGHCPGHGQVSRMTVAIIGGSGFVGRRLCSRLAAARPDVELRVVSRRPLPVPGASTIAADVGDVDALSGAIPRGAAIVNLAAVHQDNVRPAARYRQINVDGARNVCETARRRAVRTIVFTSSVAVYGATDAVADEATPPRPSDPYGASKLAAETVYGEWQAEDPARTLAIVRPAPLFGEHGGGNVAAMLRWIASSRFRMVGKGGNVKSLAYVDNAAAFLAHCLGFPRGVHLYNYVDGPDFTMAGLVALVRRELGRPPRQALQIPYPAALVTATALDGVSRVTGLEFRITASRVRRFHATTAFGTSVGDSGFVAPVPLGDALSRTVRSIVGAAGSPHA